MAAPADGCTRMAPSTVEVATKQLDPGRSTSTARLPVSALLVTPVKPRAIHGASDASSTAWRDRARAASFHARKPPIAAAPIAAAVSTRLRWRARALRASSCSSWPRRFSAASRVCRAIFSCSGCRPSSTESARSTSVSPILDFGGGLGGPLPPLK